MAKQFDVVRLPQDDSDDGSATVIGIYLAVSALVLGVVAVLSHALRYVLEAVG